ncbi:unnamed protein product [Phytomonas sp. EM1]|nr:unnamed protein product [Phytomonas sp. EM1]|eukprot:CCW63426.1 unnamed protein product [Phytomonas sp. isolate EM1]
MTASIAVAEQLLAVCVEKMRDALQATLEDALPESELGASAPSNTGDLVAWGGAHANDIPDTLKQRLEWEQGVEQQRVGSIAAAVQHSFQQLKAAVVELGGGVNASGEVIDVLVAELDYSIERISSERSRLGKLMVEYYGEAERLAAAIEEEILSIKVPSLK